MQSTAPKQFCTHSFYRKTKGDDGKSKIQAIDLDLHAELGAFIALIVVNCLILGRMEAFAARNPPLPAVLDAIGMGLGFTWALLCLGVLRETLGFGTLFGPLNP